MAEEIRGKTKIGNLLIPVVLWSKMRPQTYQSTSPLWQKRQYLRVFTLGTLYYVAVLAWGKRPINSLEFGFLGIIFCLMIIVWFDWFHYRQKNKLQGVVSFSEIIVFTFRNWKDSDVFASLFILLPCISGLGFLFARFDGLRIGLIIGFVYLLISVMAERYPLYE